MKKLQILYNFIPYKVKKRGLFSVHDDSGKYLRTGYKQKIIEVDIIGEDSTSFVYELKPYARKLFGKPECYLPIGIHKSRLKKWITGQVSLFLNK